MADHEGPIDVKSCEECRWMSTEFKIITVHYCSHPQGRDFIDPEAPGWIGHDTLTPVWCPFPKEQA